MTKHRLLLPAKDVADIVKMWEIDKFLHRAPLYECPVLSYPQVMWWIQRMRGAVKAPLSAPLYGLLAKRRVYGVDYGLYMHQLANDIGAAPDLLNWLTRPKVLLAYALGQAYITFFR
jgi:hypothetical protein